MSNDINLILRQAEQTPKPSNNAIIFRNISFGVLFCVFGSTGLIYLLTLFSPLAGLQQKERQLIDSFQTYQVQLYQNNTVQDRMKKITSLLNDRYHFDATYDAVKEQVPDGLSMKGLKFDKNKMSFTLISTDLKPIDTFLSQLVSVNKAKKQFSTITLSSINYNLSQAQYEVDIDLQKE